MNDFFNVVRDFILVYLPTQRGFSSNTITSYKTTLNLFIKFMKEEKGVQYTSLTFRSINKDILSDFLNWIEDSRKCSETTRNQRLMALRSFFEYAGQRDNTQMGLYLSICNIPIKEAHSKVVSFLSETALETLLKQPDLKKQKGLRDMFLMILMYDTAARCSEITGMKIKDLCINGTTPKAYLHGKGDKTRVVPLMPKTVEHCKKYLKKYHPDLSPTYNTDTPLFFTTMHNTKNEMSIDAVEAMLKKYGIKAAIECPEMPKKIHPHLIRHTRAMHLYRSGMPLELLSQFLGHANIETTLIYAYADTEMKREAIRKADCVRNGKDIPIEIWADDEDMILKLSGLK